MHTLLKLFLAFCRIGAFTFGGGYSMLPMLQREVVERHGWATEEELLDYFAVGQCTPGVIAVNTATFIGYKEKKIAGAICATLGVILPSIVIILAIAMVLDSFSHIPAVQHAFSGIRVAVGALIVSAVIQLFRKNVKSIFQIALCILAFVVVAVFGQSPIYVVIGAAIAGLVAGKVVKKHE